MTTTIPAARELRLLLPGEVIACPVDGQPETVGRVRKHAGQRWLLATSRHDHFRPGTTPVTVTAPLDLSALREHVRAGHPRLNPRGPLGTLSREHAEAHYKFSPGHRHAGTNTGPGDRPPGWRTGKDAIPAITEGDIR